MSERTLLDLLAPLPVGRPHAARWLAMASTLSMLVFAPASPADEAEARNAAAPLGEPMRFEREHQGTFGGRTVHYRSTAGETFLRDDDGEPRAAVFTFAYVRSDVEDVARRPLTFVWNGGPGSSSVWLHMGALGPKRVPVPDAADDGAPPYPLIDNPEALLDMTDLVFVDPVGTGFSRPLGDHEAESFWGLAEDADAIADLVAQWTTDHGRWPSPKVLLGESFGTMRAVAVADRLASEHNLGLNALILVSQALDYTGSTPVHDNVIGYLTYLPTMAATAWYHDRVKDKPTRLEDFLAEVRRFVVEDYAPALLRGSQLDPETRAEVAGRLAAYTGLSTAYVERSDLRLLAGRFLKELRRDDGVALGRLDSRYAADESDDTADRPASDAAFDAIRDAYTAALQQYLYQDLDVRMKSRYKVSAGRALGNAWRWRTVPDGAYWEPAAPNVARALGDLMRRNTDLQILVQNGYYDFATPFYDAEYTFARHGIVADRVRMTYYEAGHMMYLHEPSRTAFLDDLRSFYADVVPQP